MLVTLRSAYGLALFALLVGCGHQKSISTERAPSHITANDDPAQTVASASLSNGSAPPHTPSSLQGQLFRFAVNTLPERMDPAFADDLDASQVLNNLYEGLVAHGPDQALQPGVAENWHVSGNGTVYVFKLRRNARWSNGDAVTAHDFRRAWLRLLSPRIRSPNRDFVLGIQGAQAYLRGQAPASSVAIEPVDDFTLRVTLVYPTPFFPALCATTALRPVPRSSAVKRPLGPPNGQVTNGPYRLARIIGSKSIELVKNSHYWDANRVRVPRIRIHAVADNQDALRMFNANELDWTGTVDLPFEERSRLAKRPDYVQEQNYGVYFLRMNLAHNWLKDNRIRHALSRAIDRRALAHDVGEGIRAAYHFVPPTPGYTSPNSPLRFDPAGTSRALKRAMPRPLKRPLTLFIDRSSNHQAVAQTLRNSWKAHLNLDVRIAVHGWREHQAILMDRTYHLGRSGWIGDYRDPLSFLKLWETDSVHNQTGWSDREYDGLLEKARRASRPLVRQDLLRAAEKILLTRGPVIPLFYFSSAYLLNRHFTGISPQPLGLHALKNLRYVPVAKDAVGED
ncbi:MAG: peptide ABC transporter substrate-binding protein [Myxococcota bacterium]|nr:peptide ABC transporter substrate-binding protein [Myxococcota bacterium]